MWPVCDYVRGYLLTIAGWCRACHRLRGAVQSSTSLRDSTDAAAFYAATEYRKIGKLPTIEQVIEFVSGNDNISSGEYELNTLCISRSHLAWISARKPKRSFSLVPRTQSTFSTQTMALH
jgi:hypothetical protein